jgi:hypothetical protein
MNAGLEIENLKGKIEKSVNDGYNVLIFPEGLRSEDEIRRFKQGAFYLAGEIGADILPMYLHGTGHVMPKGSGFASRGQVDLEIGKRIPASELTSYGPTYPKIAHAVQEEYAAHYQQMKTEIETTHYFHHYVIDKYTYKGIGVERETRRLLKKYDDFSAWIDGYTPVEGKSGGVSVLHAGRGQFSFLFALVHPETEVYSYADTTDDYDMAKACEPLPANLHIRNAMTESVDEARTHVVNLNDILEI